MWPVPQSSNGYGSSFARDFIGGPPCMHKFALIPIALLLCEELEPTDTAGISVGAFFLSITMDGSLVNEWKDARYGSENCRVVIMHRKEYLKDPYAGLTPKPFTGWDYVLCAVAFFLIGIASVPQIAQMIVSR
jgi:hypothetical protein